MKLEDAIQSTNFKNATHKVAEVLGNEYAVCAFGCLGKLTIWAEKKGVKVGNILCVFESGDDGQADMISKVRQWGFNAIPQNKEHLRRFDACDLVAWKSRAVIDKALYRVNIADAEENRLLRRSLSALDCIVQENGWLTPWSLNGICSEQKIPTRTILGA